MKKIFNDDLQDFTILYITYFHGFNMQKWRKII